MSKRKRVGIMGGTFNPIHLGHLILGENAYEELELDEILFVPSGNPYMKNYVDVLDTKTRITMTGDAIEDNPHFALSTIEVDRDGNSYSYQTIETLKENNPNTDYYFIIGADSLFLMENWMHPEKIFPEVTIAVAVRGEYDHEKLDQKIEELKEKYKGTIVKLSCRSVDISSTNIRKRVKEGKSIRYMVRHVTDEYIKRYNIFKEM